jgi:hypothetical protein
MLALALLLSIVGNSGGIVGLITARVGRNRAAFRLGLAALKILPQRDAQTPPLPHPICALGTIVHGTRLGAGGARRKALWRSDRPLDGARLRHFRPCGKDRRARSQVPFSLLPPASRCRSSVVEHPLGKGEVVSSILTGSTSRLNGHLDFRPGADALIHVTARPSWTLLRSPRPLPSRTAAIDPRRS